MKYIRTKDGIIYENAKQMIDRNWQVVAKSGRGIKVSNNLICKQADTIEELCDAIIVFENGRPKVHMPCDKHNVYMLRNVWYENRFAIWTDKGLIYVAKMNEKGELELL